MQLQQLIEQLDSPAQIEALYRQYPQQFTELFPQVYQRYPEHLLVQIWYQRLFFTQTASTIQAESATQSFSKLIILSIVTTSLMKLPDFWSAIDSSWFYSHFAIEIELSALMIYFLMQRKTNLRFQIFIIAFSVFCFIWSAMLIDTKESDSVFLALIHLPLLFWTLIGLAFCGLGWRLSEMRMQFIRLNAELLIYNSVILLGGMILTALTLSLAELLDSSRGFADWYMKNIALWGWVTSPLLSCFLIEKSLINQYRASAILAKIFSPLFLITVIFYLIALALQHKSLYTDRDFLLTFNLLLLVVLAIVMLSIAENQSNRTLSHIWQWLNIGLIITTLLIDLLALTAISYRLIHYGMTVNRVVVSVSNLLIFIHLIGILYAYIKGLHDRNHYQFIQQWVTEYLPVYSVWTAVVVFILPFLFQFK
ncbi:MAG: hypothetical protein RL637_571 [Pseudomonadota bacterium]